MDTNTLDTDMKEVLEKSIENMDLIVDKLLDCGYNIKYDGFENCSSLSYRNNDTKGVAFCEIYPKDNTDYTFDNRISQEHSDLIRL